MTMPRMPGMHQWSSESIVDQALAVTEHAKTGLKNTENDPQAIANVETDLRGIEAMLRELRRRYGNQRRDAKR